MRTLFKGGEVVNVFTDSLARANVVVEDGIIIGVGDYYDAKDDNCDLKDDNYDEVVDCSGMIICPGFIDSHIHIESTMLAPHELAKAILPCGTTAIVADPHEIANVCGIAGIEYMLEATENLPLSVYVMASSCVPAVPLDESAGVLDAKALKPLYDHERVLGLAEMMNYPGVIAGDSDVKNKIEDAKALGGRVNGHAPLLSGEMLDKYISAGIEDDHECSAANEAIEKMSKGMHILIREGTAAKNLKMLSPLFEYPYSARCLLCTDDKSAADIINEGHIDSIVKKAAALGRSPFAAIRMATIQAAEYYGLKNLGAIAPGYKADMIIASDIESLEIKKVYKNGKKVCEDGAALPFDRPEISDEILKRVKGSVNVKGCAKELFDLGLTGKHTCRVIKVIPGSIITDEVQLDIDFANGTGIDTNRDILKVAVLERHNGTGHAGAGFINGIGLKKGALAATVSHDSHNIIVIGADEDDMALCVNEIIKMQGGMAAAADGVILSALPLEIGGLMSTGSAKAVAKENDDLIKAAAELGCNEGIAPFMNMAFLSLSVIPHLKITSRGLLDADTQEIKNILF